MTEAKENKQEIDFSKDFTTCAKGKNPPKKEEVIAVAKKLSENANSHRWEAEVNVEKWDKVEDLCDNLMLTLQKKKQTPIKHLQKCLAEIRDEVEAEVWEPTPFFDEIEDIKEVLDDMLRLRYREIKEAKLK